MKPNPNRRRRPVSSNTNYETLEVRKLLAADIATFVSDGQIGESSNVELTFSTSQSNGLQEFEASDAEAQDAIASDRFIAIEEHINGIDTMTVGELQSWANAFASEAGSLGNRLEDFVAAVEVVELYEDVVGPLFTSQGVSNFNNSWDGDNNLGRGLGRAMLTVYQAVFDAYDNDLVSQNPALVDGTLFRSTENFPGSVPNPTDPAAIYEVQIDGTLNEEFGYVGGYSTNAARRFTGAYLAPGTIVEVIVPNELVNAGYQVRVGGHSWDLTNKNNVNRLFRVSNLFDITDNVVQVANPMGGNIYIEVPVGADAGIVDVQFRNTIRAPFFSNRTFDQTSESEWNVERNHLGAFTDIESEHSMWTVPSKWVRNLSYDALMEIIEAHDANIQVATEYAGKNPTRHKASLYMIVDTQIRGNAFSIGYPQSNYGTFSQNTIRGPLTLDNAFDKVLWHEHGHSEFLTMFSGETESLVHMAAFYIGVENYGYTVQEAFANSLAYGSTNHTTSDTLSSWVVMDEFINGQNMAFQQGSYRPRGHADYVEYVELFGLDALRNFNRRVNIEFDGTNLNDSFDEGGRTSHTFNDRILRLSREAGVNVAPLFHLWGHAPNNASQLNASLAAEGLGDSVQIYDRMIEARDSVPLTQAEWNAVDSVMRDFLNEARGPWQELRTNYDVSRGQDAVDRIQVLIDTYFPSGRPAEGPAVVPIAATVTAFADPNFEGTPWELSVGIHTVGAINAGPIGNNAISSFLVPAGYELTVYQHSNIAGATTTYTDSVATLSTVLDNDISHIIVTSTLENQETIGESDTIPLDNQWTTVTLKQSYNDPVVIAGTPSYEGVDPSTVRIRNVTSNSFEIQIDEWDYLNPFHSREVVSYMVVEAGQYTLADGTIVVAGNQTGQDQAWQTYNLGSAFDGLGAPIVLTSVVTDFDPTAVTTRVRVNSNSQFEVRLQEEESADGVHGAETVSYFAIQDGAGATGGLYYDAGSFAADNGGQFENFDPAVRLSSVSSFFAGMQTFVGSDATTLRNTVLNAAGVSVFAEEERSADTEVIHSAETVGFFAIAPGLITGAATEQAVESAGQYIYYNNSSFDSASDSAAIATDKVVLRDGETATFENYTSFIHGINGIAVDLVNPTTPSSSDFQVKFGNGDDVDTWATLDSSLTITNLTTVAGAGVNGSDRVFIEFAYGAFTNGWLQVTVLANSSTGLTSDDVFYFGNAIGESGNDPANGTVNLADVAGARTNQTGFGTTDMLNVFDFNRDARVNLADVAIARTNQSGFTPIRLITPISSSGGPSSKVLPSAQSTASTSVSLPVSLSTTELATPKHSTSELSTLNLSSFAVAAVAATVETKTTVQSELEEAEQRNHLALAGANLYTEDAQQDALDGLFETTVQENDLANNIQLTDIDSIFETDFSADL